MIRAISLVAICFCDAAAVLGQATATQRFEVASVRPANLSTWDGTSGIHTGHGRLTATNVTLKRCIMGAFGVRPNLIVGGPQWLDSEHFDIVAKAEQPLDGDSALMVMLQTLLAERFKLAIHRESRTVSVLVMEVAKGGPKLDKALEGEGKTLNGRGRLEVKVATMDRFAEVLSRQTDLPVVNRTGLEGVFDVKLEWTPESKSANASATPAESGPSIFTAIQQQLGLRLRSEKTALDVLVVDHAEKPSEN